MHNTWGRTRGAFTGVVVGVCLTSLMQASQPTLTFEPHRDPVATSVWRLVRHFVP